MARMIPLYSVSSQAEIERLARLFYEEEGRPVGRELDHWLRAEEKFREGWDSGRWRAAATAVQRQE